MMAETAGPGRAHEQRWTGPDSTRDRVVRWVKIILPSGVGVLIAVLAVAPLGKKSDVSFLVNKKTAETAPERMRVEEARYTGTDDKGQVFTMTANRAIQPSSDVPIVDLSGLSARLDLAQGPLLLAANQGRYNLDTQRVAIDGPVKVAGADGYKLDTRDVVVDLRDRRLTSFGPVAGQMRLGQFQAGQLSADLGSRTVVLGGGARLKIVQGTVR